MQSIYPRGREFGCVMGHVRVSSKHETAESLILGISPSIAEVRYLVRQVARSSASVLVTGASGSGKEMVARGIHAESERSKKPYVALNCGAIPRELLESELFGHEKGSFTGAIGQKRGRFEDANGGTFFLDEIGDMPTEMQVKLLRVLEERSIQRVGGRDEIAVDTRIVSATHRNLEEAIRDQRFREDLFYRLAVFPIELPSLEQRREDIPLLIRHFLQAAGEAGRVKFSQEAMNRLVMHSWPGNVRELRNVIERAVILFSGQVVSSEQVERLLNSRARSSNAERTMLWDASVPPVEIPPSPSEPELDPESCQTPGLALGNGPVDLRKVVGELEYRYIQEALRLSEGVVADAARLLSLQRTTLIEKMRKHGFANSGASSGADIRPSAPSKRPEPILRAA